MNETLLRKLVAGLSILFCVLTLPVSAQQSGDPTATEFLRFLPGEGEFAHELQTSVTTYRNDRGVEVDLVATVHIADRSYYEGLNNYFSTRDAVLYELVAEETVRPDGQGVGRSTGIVGFLQTSLTRVLGLSYQLDVINYARPNFMHADLEPAELDAIMAARGETLFSSILSMVLTEIELQEQKLAQTGTPPAELTLTDIIRLFSLPNRQDAFKYLLGQSLAGSEGSLVALTGRGITILDDRNQAALAALEQGLLDPSLSRLSIFYGAAHMPGIAQGLQQQGFQEISRSWLTAWKADGPPN